VTIVRCVSAVWTLLALGVSTTLGGEPAASQSKTKTISIQQYTVNCRVTSKAGILLTTPKITVRVGQEWSISSESPKLFVIGTESDGISPVTREVTEGFRAEGTLLGDAKDKVILDISVEASGGPRSERVKEDGIRWKTEKWRAIEPVALGKKSVFAFDRMDLEVVVNAVPSVTADGKN